jgi:alanine racemase
LAAAFGAGLRPVHHHLAATAATLNDPASHHTLSRVGAGLVGIDPTRSTTDQTRFTTDQTRFTTDQTRFTTDQTRFTTDQTRFTTDQTRLHLDQTRKGRSADVLWPALSLRAPLVEVRRVAAGTSVGYGRAWRARRPTTLGLLPLGYADGLPRIASGRAFVSVAGHRCPLVGTGSMDMSVVDLGPSSEAHPGTSVLVFGPGDSGEPTVTEWASWAGTIEHEIVTGIGARVSRRLIPAGEPTTIWQPRVVRDGCR